MKDPYVKLYHDLVIDLASLEQSNLPEKKKIENGFWIAHSYWKELKALVMNHKFNSEEEEIDFFRNVKPQFTSHIEYFLVLSESLRFEPTQPGDACEFWKAEAKSFLRFCSKNKFFVEYYESGDRHQDRQFFLQREKSPRSTRLKNVNYEDADCCSSHDNMVRRLLAYKKLKEYIYRKLEVLQDGDPLQKRISCPLLKADEKNGRS